MKKTLVIVLLALLAMGMVFAAGSKEAAAPKAKEIKVALIIANTIDDKGWCQAMHDGITEAMAELPSGKKAIAPAQSPPIAFRSANVFSLGILRISAIRVRTMSSGRRLDKKASISPCLYGSALNGKQCESGS